MANILVLNGPNLNLLGNREPALYGQETLPDLNKRLLILALELGHTLTTMQSNSEHVLVDRIQQAATDNTHLMIINPAAFTHTSIAMRDALLAVGKPFIEVHISNIHSREAFRQHSYFSDIATGVMTGLGTEGYLLALRYAHHFLTQHTKLGSPESHGLTKN